MCHQLVCVSTCQRSMRRRSPLQRLASAVEGRHGSTKAGGPNLPGMGATPAQGPVEDVHELARGMPHVTVWDESADRPVYMVGGKSFVFFRNARPDAKDPETGERYDDVICVWVPSEDDKRALVQDQSSPWFTTSQFDGHPSVLVRESRLGELSRDELAEVIEDAWLSRASKRRVALWLAEHQND